MFTEADFQASAGPVIVLSHMVWEERLGSTPAVIGQEIEIDGGRCAPRVRIEARRLVGTATVISVRRSAAPCSIPAPHEPLRGGTPAAVTWKGNQPLPIRFRGCSVNTSILFGVVALLVAWSPAAAPQASFDLKEWAVEWGGRTRDPAVAADGKVWFVGQTGNYIAVFDPKGEQFKRYEIEEGTNPHTVIVDSTGIVWYAGNRNNCIGRLDPSTGAIKTIATGEARDPHTMVLDGNGHIWFTSQGSNRVGRLHMTTGKVDLVTPYEQPSNPYGIVLDSKGTPWVALLRTNMVARIDPATLAVTLFSQANEKSRARRIEVTSDGMVWTGDEARGFLIRINPGTKETKEWQVPGGPGARPYALTKDDRGRLWLSETGPEKRLVGFDPKTEQFFAAIPVSGTIRHMHFDPKTKMLWFGTDANKIGRLDTTGTSAR